MENLLKLGAAPESFVIVGFAVAFAADMLGKAVRWMVALVSPPGSKEIEL